MTKFDGLLIEADRPYRVEILNLNGEPLRDASGAPAWVEVYSRDSVRIQPFERARQDRLIAGKSLTDDEYDSDAAGELAALTAGWYLLRLDGTPLTGDDGAPLVFSAETAKQLYGLRAARWLVAQIRAGTVLRRNFMPAPSKP